MVSEMVSCESGEREVEVQRILCCIIISKACQYQIDGLFSNIKVQIYKKLCLTNDEQGNII